MLEADGVFGADGVLEGVRVGDGVAFGLRVALGVELAVIVATDLPPPGVGVTSMIGLAAGEA